MALATGVSTAAIPMLTGPPACIELDCGDDDEILESMLNMLIHSHLGRELTYIQIYWLMDLD